MLDEFVTFQRFIDGGLAEALAKHLRAADIEFTMEDSSPPLSSFIIGDGLEADISLKLRPADFEKAHALLNDYYQQQTAVVDADYYLHPFTTDELKEIIEKPDEWGGFDYHLAKRLLAERAVDIQPVDEQQIKKHRLTVLAQPEVLDKSWMLLGYFMAVFFAPIGMFYGWCIHSFKRTLPNGQRIYSYNDKARKHGLNMLIIGGFLSATLLLFRMLNGRG